MIVEFRTYTLNPGTTPQFEERFAEALPARTKVSPLAAFWHTEVGPLNQVVHVWKYASQADREKKRDALMADPAFKEYLAKSRELGAHQSQECRILKSTSFSPL